MVKEDTARTHLREPGCERPLPQKKKKEKERSSTAGQLGVGTEERRTPASLKLLPRGSTRELNTRRKTYTLINPIELIIQRPPARIHA